MKIFDKNIFDSLPKIDKLEYTKECYPIGSKFYMDENDKRSHYREGIFTVTGYNTNAMNDPLLVTDTRLGADHNYTHPYYIKLHKPWLRNKKLEEILK